MNVNYLNKITYPSANYIVARGLDDASMMSGCVAITEEYAITSSNGKGNFVILLLVKNLITFPIV